MKSFTYSYFIHCRYSESIRGLGVQFADADLGLFNVLNGYPPENNTRIHHPLIVRLRNTFILDVYSDIITSFYSVFSIVSEDLLLAFDYFNNIRRFIIFFIKFERSFICFFIEIAVSVVSSSGVTSGSVIQITPCSHCFLVPASLYLVIGKRHLRQKPPEATILVTSSTPVISSASHSLADYLLLGSLGFFNDAFGFFDLTYSSGFGADLCDLNSFGLFLDWFGFVKFVCSGLFDGGFHRQFEDFDWLSFFWFFSSLLLGYCDSRYWFFIVFLDGCNFSYFLFWSLLLFDDALSGFDLFDVASFSANLCYLNSLGLFLGRFGFNSFVRYGLFDIGFLGQFKDFDWLSFFWFFWNILLGYCDSRYWFLIVILDGCNFSYFLFWSLLFFDDALSGFDLFNVAGFSANMCYLYSLGLFLDWFGFVRQFNDFDWLSFFWFFWSLLLGDCDCRYWFFIVFLDCCYFGYFLFWSLLLFDDALSGFDLFNVASFSANLCNLHSLGLFLDWFGHVGYNGLCVICLFCGDLCSFYLRTYLLFDYAFCDFLVHGLTIRRSGFFDSRFLRKFDDFDGLCFFWSLFLGNCDSRYWFLIVFLDGCYFSYFLFGSFLLFDDALSGFDLLNVASFSANLCYLHSLGLFLDWFGFVRRCGLFDSCFLRQFNNFDRLSFFWFLWSLLLSDCDCRYWFFIVFLDGCNFSYFLLWSPLLFDDALSGFDLLNVASFSANLCYLHSLGLFLDWFGFVRKFDDFDGLCFFWSLLLSDCDCRYWLFIVFLDCCNFGYFLFCSLLLFDDALSGFDLLNVASFSTNLCYLHSLGLFLDWFGFVGYNGLCVICLFCGDVCSFYLRTYLLFDYAFCDFLVHGLTIRRCGLFDSCFLRQFNNFDGLSFFWFFWSLLLGDCDCRYWFFIVFLDCCNFGYFLFWSLLLFDDALSGFDLFNIASFSTNLCYLHSLGLFLDWFGHVGRCGLFDSCFLRQFNNFDWLSFFWFFWSLLLSDCDCRYWFFIVFLDCCNFGYFLFWSLLLFDDALSGFDLFNIASFSTNLCYLHSLGLFLDWFGFVGRCGLFDSCFLRKFDDFDWLSFFWFFWSLLLSDCDCRYWFFIVFLDCCNFGYFLFWSLLLFDDALSGFDLFYIASFSTNLCYLHSLGLFLDWFGFVGYNGLCVICLFCGDLRSFKFRTYLLFDYAFCDFCVFGLTVRRCGLFNSGFLRQFNDFDGLSFFWFFWSLLLGNCDSRYWFFIVFLHGCNFSYFLFWSLLLFDDALSGFDLFYIARFSTNLCYLHSLGLFLDWFGFVRRCGLFNSGFLRQFDNFDGLCFFWSLLLGNCDSRYWFFIVFLDGCYFSYFLLWSPLLFDDALSGFDLFNVASFSANLCYLHSLGLFLDWFGFVRCSGLFNSGFLRQFNNFDWLSFFWFLWSLLLSDCDCRVAGGLFNSGFLRQFNDFDWLSFFWFFWSLLLGNCDSRYWFFIVFLDWLLTVRGSGLFNSGFLRQFNDFDGLSFFCFFWSLLLGYCDSRYWFFIVFLDCCNFGYFLFWPLLLFDDALSGFDLFYVAGFSAYLCYLHSLGLFLDWFGFVRGSGLFNSGFLRQFDDFDGLRFFCFFWSLLLGNCDSHYWFFIVFLDGCNFSYFLLWSLLLFDDALSGFDLFNVTGFSANLCYLHSLGLFLDWFSQIEFVRCSLFDSGFLRQFYDLDGLSFFCFFWCLLLGNCDSRYWFFIVFLDGCYFSYFLLWSLLLFDYALSGFDLFNVTGFSVNLCHLHSLGLFLDWFSHIRGSGLFNSGFLRQFNDFDGLSFFCFFWSLLLGDCDSRYWFFIVFLDCCNFGYFLLWSLLLFDDALSGFDLFNVTGFSANLCHLHSLGLFLDWFGFVRGSGLFNSGFLRQFNDFDGLSFFCFFWSLLLGNCDSRYWFFIVFLDGCNFSYFLLWSLLLFDDALSGFDLFNVTGFSANLCHLHSLGLFLDWFGFVRRSGLFNCSFLRQFDDFDGLSFFWSLLLGNCDSRYWFFIVFLDCCNFGYFLLWSLLLFDDALSGFDLFNVTGFSANLCHLHSLGLFLDWFGFVRGSGLFNSGFLRQFNDFDGLGFFCLFWSLLLVIFLCLGLPSGAVVSSTVRFLRQFNDFDWLSFFWFFWSLLLGNCDSRYWFFIVFLDGCNFSYFLFWSLLLFDDALSGFDLFNVTGFSANLCHLHSLGLFLDWFGFVRSSGLFDSRFLRQFNDFDGLSFFWLFWSLLLGNRDSSYWFFIVFLDGCYFSYFLLWSLLLFDDPLSGFDLLNVAGFSVNLCHLHSLGLFLDWLSFVRFMLTVRGSGLFNCGFLRQFDDFDGLSFFCFFWCLLLGNCDSRYWFFIVFLDGCYFSYFLFCSLLLFDDALSSFDLLYVTGFSANLCYLHSLGLFLDWFGFVRSSGLFDSCFLRQFNNFDWLSFFWFFWSLVFGNCDSRYWFFIVFLDGCNFSYFLFCSLLLFDDALSGFDLLYVTGFSANLCHLHSLGLFLDWFGFVRSSGLFDSCFLRQFNDFDGLSFFCLFWSLVLVSSTSDDLAEDCVSSEKCSVPFTRCFVFLNLSALSYTCNLALVIAIPISLTALHILCNCRNLLSTESAAIVDVTPSGLKASNTISPVSSWCFLFWNRCFLFWNRFENHLFLRFLFFRSPSTCRPLRFFWLGFFNHLLLFNRFEVNLFWFFFFGCFLFWNRFENHLFHRFLFFRSPSTCRPLRFFWLGFFNHLLLFNRCFLFWNRFENHLFLRFLFFRSPSTCRPLRFFWLGFFNHLLLFDRLELNLFWFSFFRFFLFWNRFENHLFLWFLFFRSPSTCRPLRFFWLGFFNHLLLFDRLELNLFWFSFFRFFLFWNRFENHLFLWFLFFRSPSTCRPLRFFWLGFFNHLLLFNRFELNLFWFFFFGCFLFWNRFENHLFLRFLFFRSPSTCRPLRFFWLGFFNHLLLFNRLELNLFWFFFFGCFLFWNRFENHLFLRFLFFRSPSTCRPLRFFWLGFFNHLLLFNRFELNLFWFFFFGCFLFWNRFENHLLLRFLFFRSPSTCRPLRFFWLGFFNHLLLFNSWPEFNAFFGPSDPSGLSASLIEGTPALAFFENRGLPDKSSLSVAVA
ncbi:hypothetical protein HW555_002210 [Spodoptera exigua]|uniref:Uncharacterized protein n=1 Tax=Spodoptera exigua TaxID=7107 RepID=A0A835GQ38_SPOEX|nr:hypothetical protein HW555_002210 [Spodoptera exigua]